MAPNSTVSPANSTFSFGSHTTVSPAVWLRPTWITCASRSPSQIVMRLWKVWVGQVRPGIVSLPRNRRGKRPISLSMSCRPRSAISARVTSDAMTAGLP